MAVQRWQQRSTNTITKEDISSAYSALLYDINECLCSCNTLETGRSYRRMATDWAAGHRGNIPKLVELMKDLKKEVENGLYVFSKLMSKVNELEQQDMSNRSICNYASSNMNSYAKILGDSYSLFAQALVNLQEVGGILGGKLIKAMAKEVGLTSASIAVPLLLTPGVGLAFSVGMLGYSIARADGIERGCEYLKLQSIFESLDNPELMGTLQATHYTAERLIRQIDELVRHCKAKAIEFETRRREELEYKTKQLEYTTRAITLEKNTIEDGVKAVKIFVNTKSEELRELVATEPGMRENDRERIATRAAVRNCKTFLMEKLRYSNAEADELINKIKN